MPGHLEKRGKNSWTIVLEYGKNPATGRRRRIKRSFQGRKRDAEKEMARLVNEIETGMFIETSQLTFGDYMTSWLEEYGQTNLSATTYRRYSSIINLRIIPRLGMVPLDKLKPLHLQKFFSDIIKEGRLDGPHKGKPMSQASITYHYRVIHRALQTALKQQLVPRNVADAVDVPKIMPEVLLNDDDADVSDEIKVLTGDEVQIMLEKAKETPYYTLLFLAVRTGMRRGELLGLRWQDVDFSGQQIKVRQSLAYTPQKGLFFKLPKTQKSKRTIDITEEVINVLKLHKKEQAGAKLYLGQAYEDHGLVFCQRTGPPMHPDTPSSWFPNFLERIGLPRLNFHALRHTHASLLLKAGVDIKIISDRLGHSSIRITYDIYSHLMPGMQREAARALESLLKN